MDEVKYNCDISYSIYSHKPISIKCFTYINTNNILNLINFHIITNPTPSLRLDCYTSNLKLELFEYGINYIIDNKIGKYNHLEILPYDSIKYYNIIVYFDIIDANILLRLL